MGIHDHDLSTTISFSLVLLVNKRVYAPEPNSMEERVGDDVDA